MEQRLQGPNPQRENNLQADANRARLRLVEKRGNSKAVICSIGQDLRNARKRKGLELSQISGCLKISKRHLNALEEGDVEALPLGDVYLIGYTRSYASYLGLNTGQCLEKLKSGIADRDCEQEALATPSSPQEYWLLGVFRLGLRSIWKH